jgi:hypothetical protein
VGKDVADNPIGVLYDPEQLIRDYEGGLALEDLRVESPGA